MFKGRHILIVDDEHTISVTLAEIFSRHGFVTRSTESAEEALQLLDAWRPDLAIVDVVLPGINGIDFAVALKQVYPQCEVLLFSGHPNSAYELQQALRDAHYFEFLPKPVHPDILVQRTLERLAIADLHQPAPAPVPVADSVLPTESEDEIDPKGNRLTT